MPQGHSGKEPDDLRRFQGGSTMATLLQEESASPGKKRGMKKAQLDKSMEGSMREHIEFMQL